VWQASWRLCPRCRRSRILPTPVPHQRVRRSSAQVVQSFYSWI
jgi:hypothetical protein